MKKRLLVIGAIVIAIIAICLLSFPIPYNQTLNAVKLDAVGNEIGTVQISIEGRKWCSLLQKDYLDVNVGGFDDILPMQINTSEWRKNVFEEYQSATFAIVNSSLGSTDGTASTVYGYTLNVCPDFDRWVILIRSGTVTQAYYVGSISGNYTTEEIAEYFNVLVPG